MDTLIGLLFLVAFIAMLVGLVKPSALHIRWLTARYQVFAVGMGVLLLLMVIGISLLPETDEERQKRLAREAKIKAQKQEQALKEVEKARIDAEVQAKKEAELAVAKKEEEQAKKAKEVKENTERSKEKGKTEDVAESETNKPKAVKQGKPDKELTPEERRSKELHRRTKDPTYLTDLRKVLEEQRELIAQAETALKENNHELVSSLFSSGMDLFRRNNVHYTPKGWLLGNWGKPYSWFHPEEETAWKALDELGAIHNLAQHKRMEAEYADRGALFTREGTFERLVELAILEKFSVYEGRVRRLGFDREGSRGEKFVKNIDYSNGILTVLLRADSDAYDIDFRNGEITPTHPIKTMRRSQKFFAFVFNPRGAGWPRSLTKEFQKVKEVNITLYFPGERADEIVIARYGLTRKAFEAIVKPPAKKWAKLKAKDGTFQDFLKVHGTYYLHREMPDLGTPAHLLRK